MIVTSSSRKVDVVTSCQSSDSGHFSDNDNIDNNTHLTNILTKGLTLVNTVKHELNKVKPDTDTRDDTAQLTQPRLSSRICVGGGNSNKVIIKIGEYLDHDDNETDQVIGQCSQDSKTVKQRAQQQRMVEGREIAADSSGTISVPVPYTVYNV